MASVRLEGISKRFKSKRTVTSAVESLSLEIADRELIVVVGPSGCGKTTLLRLIAGLEELTAGTVFIDGRDVTRVAPKDRDVAMVFQNYALYPHMTVFKNMAFSLKMHRVSKHEIKQKVTEVANLLGIDSLLERKPSSLSGGEKQRVALGRAIVRKPNVFLFDEPLANLDAQLRVSMRTEIRNLHRNLGATIIHVTHDQEEAMTLGDRLVVLKDGRVQQIGSPQEVYDRPANRFVAEFIGTPAMNLLPGRLRGDARTTGFTTDAGDVTVQLPHTNPQDVTDQPATLGIRPEHLSIEVGADNTQYTSSSTETPPPTAPNNANRSARSHASQGSEQGDATIKGCSIRFVESLGVCNLVHVDTPGGHALVVRTQANFLPSTKESVVVHFDPVRSHIFDRDGEGRRLLTQ